MPSDASLTQHVPPANRLPSSVKPMLARLTREPFDSQSHIFELKWDGVRALAFVEGGKVRLQSRNLRDITSQFPEMATLPQSVKVASAVLDGELVIFDKDGHPSLSRLLERLKRRSRGTVDRGPQATYVAFDVLYIDGESVMGLPLLKRKALLHKIVKASRTLQPCEYIENDGIAFFDATCEHGLEGIMAKAKSSIYTPGRRSPHWLKIKRRRESDFVIGGYDFGGKRSLFGALLLGLYDSSGRFKFVGEVGTGFSESEARRIYARLEPLQTPACPFTPPPEIQSFVYWCKPEVVCRIEYGEFTENGHLHYAVYQGLMDDKDPQDCVVDEAPGWPRELLPG
ncbi:MAG: ATP-dependent DNA ligase [Chloroflexi bacterium]|nr:ATP-dependent DNA ligase [Chloroflexota bacterium]